MARSSDPRLQLLQKLKRHQAQRGQWEWGAPCWHCVVLALCCAGTVLALCSRTNPHARTHTTAANTMATAANTMATLWPHHLPALSADRARSAALSKCGRSCAEYRCVQGQGSVCTVAARACMCVCSLDGADRCPAGWLAGCIAVLTSVQLAHAKERRVAAEALARAVSQNGYLLSRRSRSLPANASGFDTHRDSISSRFDCSTRMPRRRPPPPRSTGASRQRSRRTGRRSARWRAPHMSTR
jgi:hypothetical protein